MSKIFGNEAFVRVRIDNTLRVLGWRFEEDENFSANVRLERDLKSKKHKDLLKGLSPDYVLYGENDEVIGLIEAKASKQDGQTINVGLEQCLQYAKKMRVKKAICFCSDGNITRACHVSGGSLRVNGEVVDELLPQHLVMQLAQNPNLELENEIRSVSQLIKLFENSADILRNDGVEAGLESLREFCLLLFIKVMSEKGSNLPGCGWNEIVDRHGDSLMTTYRRIVRDYQRKYQDIFRETLLTKPETLTALIEGIDGVNFSRSDLDVKGGAYEYFLAKFNIRTGSVLGQYFTPRHITRMLAKLMDFRMGDKIYDPFCGTGGMLIACYSLLYNQINTPPERERLQAKTLYGNDIAPAAAQIAKMNMVLIGDGHTNISRSDSFDNYIEQKYDAVITNIPFGLDPRTRKVAAEYDWLSTNTNEVAVLHCMHAVKRGGRAAIILPGPLAYLPGNRKLRQYIQQNASIRAVIRLPGHAFKPYTSARSFVLLLEEIWTGETIDFPFVDIQDDGFSNSARREPINRNDIVELLNCADDIGKNYSTRISADAESWFPDQEYVFDDSNSWVLGELLDVKTTKINLDPEKEYVEPKLDSRHNKVTARNEPRLGRNVRTRQKVLATPGDLIIGTLHTQSGNGLFAISDGYYICTSQIVAQIKENLVNKHYLILMLRRQFPRLSTDDLVGRENYSSEAILAVRIPKISKLSKSQQQLIERYISLCEERERADLQAREIENAIKL